MAWNHYYAHWAVQNLPTYWRRMPVCMQNCNSISNVALQRCGERGSIHSMLEVSGFSMLLDFDNNTTTQNQQLKKKKSITLQNCAIRIRPAVKIETTDDVKATSDSRHFTGIAACAGTATERQIRPSNGVVGAASRFNTRKRIFDSVHFLGLLNETTSP